jgi:anaerobic magnesium-protoporphyrin IX monomethyl ester cyclase
MKVTLIYPGITECGFNSLKGNEGSWMNHGLAVISAAIKAKGHEVNLIDLRRLTGWDHYQKAVKGQAGEVVGITMMSVDYDAAVTAAKIIKEINPKTKVFVGGPHASICPEELETLESIDFIIRGEGEITFPKMLEDLADGKKLPKVTQGYRLENLDESPWADRDLFECPEEPFVPFLKPPFVTLIAGRGCRYNCNYCQPAEKIMFGKKVRRRSVKNVIDELKYLDSRYHFNSFMLHDDCLTEDHEWVMEFCKQYKTQGFKKPFVAQSRADLICKHQDMVKALSKAGLKLCIIGFESGSDRVLKFLRKGCTRQQNLQAAQICGKLGIKVWANYMLGLPTETKEEVLETHSMLKEIKPYHCSPAFYTPHPGSDLFDIGRQMGIHMITNHTSYRRNSYEPKIKGPDYDFLKDILYKTVATEEKNYPDISAWSRFKNKSRKLLAGFPALYRSLKFIKKKSGI